MRGKRFRSVAGLLALIWLTFVLTACMADNRLKIGSIVFEGDNEWFIEATAGMKEAARDLDVNLVCEESRYDVLTELDLIRTQMKDGAGAIVLSPLTVEETGATVEEAIRSGIPVVTWNSVVKPPPTSQIVVNSPALGANTGKYLREYIAKKKLPKLKAAFIVNSSFSIGRERCQGFRESVRPLIDSGLLEVVAEGEGNLVEETTDILENIFKEHSDINFLWCWNQMSTQAAVAWLKKQGRRDVIVTGTDMSLTLAEEMLAGDIEIIAVTSQQPYEMGYRAVETAVKAAKGERVSQKLIIPTVTYTKDNPGELKAYMEAHRHLAEKD